MLSSPVHYGGGGGGEAEDRRERSGNMLAGSKRGFEESTGAFLAELKNKRFQDMESSTLLFFFPSFSRSFG